MSVKGEIKAGDPAKQHDDESINLTDLEKLMTEEILASFEREGVKVAKNAIKSSVKRQGSGGWEVNIDVPKDTIHSFGSGLFRQVSRTGPPTRVLR